jgi:hypothetical protein
VSAYEVCCAVCALLSQLTWQHLGFNFAARLTHQLALWRPRWLSFAFGRCFRALWALGAHKMTSGSCQRAGLRMLMRSVHVSHCPGYRANLEPTFTPPHRDILLDASQALSTRCYDTCDGRQSTPWETR